MKRGPLLTVLLLLALPVLLLFTGCAETTGLTRPAFLVLQPDTTGVGVKSVRVFIDGEDKGMTPGTIHVRRGFGEHVVTLHRNKEVVRKFEVEQTYTSNSSDLALSFGEDYSEGAVRYDIMDLNARKDGTLIIPYLDGRPIAIEDRQYGLTLVVRH